jgi:hypothetical protein
LSIPARHKAGKPFEVDTSELIKAVKATGLIWFHGAGKSFPGLPKLG